MGRLDVNSAETTAETTAEKDQESIDFDKKMSKGFKSFAESGWKRSDDIFDHETLISNGLTHDSPKED